MKTTMERDPNLTPHVIRACRALDRLWLDYCHDNGPGWEADISVDGGEWSGPIIEQVQNADEQRFISLVGERFGIEDRQLETFWQYSYPYDEMHCQMEATQ